MPPKEGLHIQLHFSILAGLYKLFASEKLSLQMSGRCVPRKPDMLGAGQSETERGGPAGVRKLNPGEDGIRWRRTCEEGRDVLGYLDRLC
jgi:hypothetical protein